MPWQCTPKPRLTTTLQGISYYQTKIITYLHFLHFWRDWVRWRHTQLERLISTFFGEKIMLYTIFINFLSWLQPCDYQNDSKAKKIEGNWGWTGMIYADRQGHTQKLFSPASYLHFFLKKATNQQNLTSSSVWIYQMARFSFYIWQQCFIK